MSRPTRRTTRSSAASAARPARGAAAAAAAGAAPAQQNWDNPPPASRRERAHDARARARSGNTDGDADDDGAWEDALAVDTEFAHEIPVSAELAALAASLPPGHEPPLPMYRTDPGWRAAARAGLDAARRFVEEFNHENSGTTAADGHAPMWMMPTKPHTDVYTIPWEQAQQFMPTAEQCGPPGGEQAAAAAADGGRSRSRSRSRKGRK